VFEGGFCFGELLQVEERNAFVGLGGRRIRKEKVCLIEFFSGLLT